MNIFTSFFINLNSAKIMPSNISDRIVNAANTSFCDYHHDSLSIFKNFASSS